MMRVLATILVLIAVSIGSAFGPLKRSGEISVARPIAEVRDALLDLDTANVTVVPGASGAADIRLDHRGDRFSWYVMAGNKVAVIWTADLKTDGTDTRVVLDTRPGDAPLAGLDPNFQTPTASKALFRTLVASRVDKLTEGPKATADTCFQKTRAVIEAELAANVTGSFEKGTRSRAKLERELRAMGCDRLSASDRAKVLEQLRAMAANESEDTAATRAELDAEARGY